MEKCDICSILENKESFLLVHEDELCFAILHENPAVPGHVLVIPKKHATVIEELDDESTKHLFSIANKVSSSTFDTLSVHGTNIILNNGIDAGQELPHVIVHVLPRKESDGLNFEWAPKKAQEAELKATSSMIKSVADVIFAGKPKTNDVPEVKLKKQEEAQNEQEDEDYLVKSLRRSA